MKSKILSLSIGIVIGALLVMGYNYYHYTFAANDSKGNMMGRRGGRGMNFNGSGNYMGSGNYGSGFRQRFGSGEMMSGGMRGNFERNDMMSGNNQ